MHHVLFIMICLIWGSNFILMKWAGAAFGPIGIAAGRVLGGAVVLWFFWFFTNPKTRGAPSTTTRAQWVALLIPVIIGSCYPYAMQPYLITKHQDSAFFGMMPALVPLLTAIVSIPMLRILPTWREAVGVLFGLVCMMLLMHDGGLRGVSAWDLTLAVLVPTSYACSNTFIKRRLSDMPSLYMTAMILGLSSIVLTPIGVGTEGVKPVTTTQLLTATAILIWLGVVGTGVATVIFYNMVQTRGPLYAGMVTYVIPLGALAWGSVDNETITFRQVIALLGVLASVAMVQYKNKPKPAPAAAHNNNDSAQQNP